MAQRWAKSLVTGLSALCVAGLTTPADGRVDASSPYTRAQTYSGALRYLRVDLGYEVVEKDPDAAYLIFKYTAPHAAKDSSVMGTLEVIEAAGAVRLFVSLPRMPEYQERIFRDGLLKKLRDEYGAPPPPAKKPATPPVPSAPSDKPGPAPAPEKPAPPSSDD